MNLAELQTKFQDGIIEGEKTILTSVMDSRKTGRETLFAVYHDAYRMRLAGFLSNDFPILRARLGDEAFGRLAEDYILSAPSRQRNARWYAARLPEFMSETTRWQTNRSAIDLARFERALSNAFDAADTSLSSIDALAAICTGDWPRIAFEFHPSLMLLDLSRGTAQVYAVLAAEEGEPPAIQLGEEAILFWRNNGETFYRIVAEDERLALTEAKQGKNFSDVCMLLAYQEGDADMKQRVAGFLSQWFADGLVTRLLI